MSPCFAAQHLRTHVGDSGYAFAGSYDTKGCYLYSGGSGGSPTGGNDAYEGVAFFGTGGTDAQVCRGGGDGSRALSPPTMPAACAHTHTRRRAAPHLKRLDNYQTARTKFIHYRDYNK